jgi:hypothetical protein
MLRDFCPSQAHLDIRPDTPQSGLNFVGEKKNLSPFWENESSILLPAYSLLSIILNKNGNSKEISRREIRKEAEKNRTNK